MKIKDLFVIEKKANHGLMAVEWAMLAYMLFTAVLTAILWPRMAAPMELMKFRATVLAVTLALWGLYRLVPCPLMRMVRVMVLFAFLAQWYPDTYEYNRLFENLDHIFCHWEQTVFGCQPSLVFSQIMPWHWFSEILDMGYVAYYFIFSFVLFYYALKNYKDFGRSAFVIGGSFFLYYVIFIFLPVVGPTYYFQAVGTDVINEGVFPQLHDYFNTHQECLPSPGWTDGFFYHMVEVAKEAGERPTAAFPSSHVGVTVVAMWLIWKTRNRIFFYLMLPIAVALCLATFYIQAHYAIDALAGLVSGTLFFFLLWHGYNWLPKSIRN